MTNPTLINIQIQNIGRLLKPSHFSSDELSGDEADEADIRNEDRGRAISVEFAARVVVASGARTVQGPESEASSAPASRTVTAR